MKTKFENIVKKDYIGKQENPIVMNDLLRMAKEEELKPLIKDEEQVLLLAIDMQQDFMENGALGVPGSHQDVENLTRFIYHNMENISQITVSLDTHNPLQIFHSGWWVDENGNNPDPFTPITLKDIEAGKWRAIIEPIASREYVENLEKQGKKTLVVWAYHCLQGTTGAALENQFANMVYFHSVAKNTNVEQLLKGKDPLSEMYGIIKPEYDRKNYVNNVFLESIKKFDKIVIAGEAKSHCVLESIKQILEHYKENLELTKNIYILEDCMSVIPGFEQSTEDTFYEFKNTYNVNILKSTDLIL